MRIFIRLSILCKNFHLLKVSIRERKKKDISVKTHTFSYPLSKACLDDERGFVGLMGWDGWDWDTVSSVIKEYLKAPLEEFKCLRCFDNSDI